MAGLVRPALRAILEAIHGVDAAVHEKTIGNFSQDWLLRYGVQRGVKIISESIRRIPPDLRATQPQIPWAQIIGIGNVLRHEYHRVPDVVVWNVVRDHLPPLKTAVEAMDATLDEA